MINLPHIGLYGDFEACQKNIMTFLNRNFSVIDALMQAKVNSFVSVLPEDPLEGDIYILQGFSYSSAYNEDSLMIWDGTIWIEIEAKKGIIVYVESENNIFWYNGTDWLLLPILSDSASFSNVTVETLSFIESENSQDTPDLTSPQTAVINLTGDITTIDSIQAPDPDKSGIYIYKNHTGNSVKVLNSGSVRTGTGKDLSFKDQSAIITLYSAVDGQYIVLGGSEGGSTPRGNLNLLSDPSFERGTTDNWGASVPATIEVVSGANVLTSEDNKNALEVVMSAAGVINKLIEVPSSFYGLPGIFSGKIKGFEHISEIKITQMNDDIPGPTVYEGPIRTTGGGNWTGFNVPVFIIPASNKILIELEVGGAHTITLDDLKFGPADWEYQVQDIAADLAIAEYNISILQNQVEGIETKLLEQGEVPILDIDWSLGSTFFKEVAVNSTFTFSNMVDGRVISLVVYNSSASAVTLSLPTNLARSDMALSVPAGQRNVYTFMRVSGSTYASCVDGVQ